MTTNQPLRKRRNELDGRHGVQYYAVQDNAATVATPTVPLYFQFNATTTVIDTLSSALSSGGITTFTSPKYSYYKITYVIETNTVLAAPYNTNVLANYIGIGTYAEADTPYSQTATSITYPELRVNNVVIPPSAVSVQLGFILGQISYSPSYTGLGNFPIHTARLLTEVIARAECVVLLETGDVLKAAFTADTSNLRVDASLFVNSTTVIPVNLLTGSTIYNAHLEISEFTRGL